jgi:DNA-binding IclR family transcriptional regulator
MSDLVTKSVPALERALMILEVLAKSKDGLTLSQITRKLGIPKSSAHSLLLTLERRGYLHRNVQTGRYMFGFKLFSLANMALKNIELREQARPFLKALMESTELTVHMAMLEDNEVVIIDKIEPPGLLKLGTWIGKRMDVHCTGVGKAYIAYLPEEEIDRLIAPGLARYNENTITSARKLKEELARIRKLGYSLDDEEETIGLRCIGAPIFDHTGQVVASISVAGTTAQITSENLTWLAERVKQTASAISRQLGSEPSVIESYLKK